ncbi:skin secretory protein xP2-like isoform X1 [Lates japonicus]|uniref:Skin secretory protein xP2-like isoform X1 n=1 Tax=Lates japonicus TaxID=270547 RepID=A0AAD3N885_LATJO|nr:skin secretory protein xP2-like isoform X1 [Lates japonicus]
MMSAAPDSWAETVAGCTNTHVGTGIDTRSQSRRPHRVTSCLLTLPLARHLCDVTAAVSRSADTSVGRLCLETPQTNRNRRQTETDGSRRLRGGRLVVITSVCTCARLASAESSGSAASEDTPGELPQCRMGNRKVDNMCFMISCTNWY